MTLFAIASVVFVLPRAMPGDPLDALQDPVSAEYVSDPETRARVEAYYGLDRSLPEQYVSYLGGIARGDLGWSISRNAPVSSLIAAHLPWTLLLMVTSLLLASLVAFGAGMSAAWHHGGRWDRLLVYVLTAVRGVPEYALAVVLLTLFAVILPIFPLGGSRTSFVEYANPLSEAWDVGRHLALPALALTIHLIGTKFLLVRNMVVSSLGEDYIDLARAEGLPPHRIKHRHAGRNALLPFVTVVGIQASFAVGGSIFVESVFAYPGMGQLIIKAVVARDYPVLEGCFLVLAGTVLAMNLLLELVYRRLDPRVAAR